MKLPVYFTGIPKEPVIADKDNPSQQVVGDGEKYIIRINPDRPGINFIDCFLNSQLNILMAEYATAQ
jgi:hypothetical protein